MCGLKHSKASVENHHGKSWGPSNDTSCVKNATLTLNIEFDLRDARLPFSRKRLIMYIHYNYIYIKNISSLTTVFVFCLFFKFRNMHSFDAPIFYIFYKLQFYSWEFYIKRSFLTTFLEKYIAYNVKQFNIFTLLHRSRYI